jgi:PhnB protein
MESQTRLEPYLFFGGRCEEALAYYREALGAEVEMSMRFSQSPQPLPPGSLPPGFEDKIMHAMVRIGSSRFLASDGCEAGGKFGRFSLSVSLPSADSVRRAFDRLAEGGYGVRSWPSPLAFTVTMDQVIYARGCPDPPLAV